MFKKPKLDLSVKKEEEHEEEEEEENEDDENKFTKKATKLLVEFKRHCINSNNIPKFDQSTVNEILDDCRKINEVINNLPKNEENKLKIQTFHLYICRNKRCLFAYLNERVTRIEKYFWDFGGILPESILTNLSHTEIDHYYKYRNKVHDVSAKYYLNVLSYYDTPPKDLLIEVLVLKDYGEVVLESGQSVNLIKDCIMLLKYSDAENFIKHGFVKKL